MKLSQLAYTFKGSDATVAFTDNKNFTGDEFYQLICDCTNSIPDEDEILLSCEDSYLFAAAFLALIINGKKICLPPNSSSGTLTELSKGRYCLNESKLKCLPKCNVTLEDKSSLAEIILFTSGSTGKRKKAIKALSQLEAEVDILNSTWDIKGSVIATVSHQHIYGLLFKILWPLMSGRPFYCGTAIYEDDLNNIFQKRPESCLISCPAHLDALICFKNNDFIQGKHIFSSGAPLSLTTAEKIEEISGTAPVEVFGSTETGGIAWRKQTGKPDWKLLDSVEVRIKDSILEVKSPFVENSVWYITGDKAKISGKKTFTHLGRNDRIVKVSGKRLSLTEMENRLMESEFIETAKIITVTEQGYTARESSAACCVLSSQGKEKLNAGKRALTILLRQELKNYFESVTLPRFWRFPQSFPVDGQGKSGNRLISTLFNGCTEKTKRFPKILSLSVNGDCCEFLLKIPENLVFFNGHFDEIPILPGVAQMLWAETYGEQILNSKNCTSVTKLKFSRIIKPGSVVKMKLTAAENKTSFEFTSQGTSHSSGVLHYE